jgi:hypothetical protein
MERNIRGHEDEIGFDVFVICRNILTGQNTAKRHLKAMPA